MAENRAFTDHDIDVFTDLKFIAPTWLLFFSQVYIVGSGIPLPQISLCRFYYAVGVIYSIRMLFFLLNTVSFVTSLPP
jgi:hypothetical protein